MSLNLLFDGDGMIIFVKCRHAQHINKAPCECVVSGYVCLKMQAFASSRVFVHVCCPNYLSQKCLQFFFFLVGGGGFQGSKQKL